MLFTSYRALNFVDTEVVPLKDLFEWEAAWNTFLAREEITASLLLVTGERVVPVWWLGNQRHTVSTNGDGRECIALTFPNPSDKNMVHQVITSWDSVEKNDGRSAEIWKAILGNVSLPITCTKGGGTACTAFLGMWYFVFQRMVLRFRQGKSFFSSFLLKVEWWKITPTCCHIVCFGKIGEKAIKSNFFCVVCLYFVFRRLMLEVSVFFEDGSCALKECCVGWEDVLSCKRCSLRVCFRCLNG